MDNNIQKISDQKGLATASLVLGIVGIVAMFMNISIGNSSVHIIGSLGVISIPVLIIGLILGIFGVKSSKKTFAIVGIILCAVGLILVIGLNSFYTKEFSTGLTTTESTTANTQ